MNCEKCGKRVNSKCEVCGRIVCYKCKGKKKDCRECRKHE